MPWEKFINIQCNLSFKIGVHDFSFVKMSFYTLDIKIGFLPLSCKENDIPLLCNVNGMVNCFFSVLDNFLLLIGFLHAYKYVGNDVGKFFKS